MSHMNATCLMTEAENIVNKSAATYHVSENFLIYSSTDTGSTTTAVTETTTWFSLKSSTISLSDPASDREG